ncbi:hypothetical protein MB02_16275 [Croceicoccus estronivorus]|nr:hypothetical protein MB02_16275 [Croceicoccus estronivorus]
MRPFRKQSGDLRLRPKAARRQYEITQLAFLLFGGRLGGATMLNTPQPTLGGAPLAIAMASPEGFIEVARTMRRIALTLARESKDH